MLVFYILAVNIIRLSLRRTPKKFSLPKPSDHLTPDESGIEVVSYFQDCYAYTYSLVEVHSGLTTISPLLTQSNIKGQIPNDLSRKVNSIHSNQRSTERAIGRQAGWPFGRN